MHDGASEETPQAADRTRRRRMNRQRLGWLVVLAVVVSLVLAFYFVFVYVPSFPIAAGTVVHLEGNQTAEWYFRVTRCCANITGAASADHPVGWWIGVWSLNHRGEESCRPQSPGGPAVWDFRALGFGDDLGPGEYLFGITCGSQPSVTVTFTQTVDLSYG